MLISGLANSSTNIAQYSANTLTNVAKHNKTAHLLGYQELIIQHIELIIKNGHFSIKKASLLLLIELSKIESTNKLHTSNKNDSHINNIIESSITKLKKPHNKNHKWLNYCMY